MAKNLSEREAYAAMFAFLEHRYRLTKSDDLGALLGDMFLLPDGSASDPAIRGDWLDAIKAAETGSVDIYLRLRK